MSLDYLIKAVVTNDFLSAPDPGELFPGANSAACHGYETEVFFPHIPPGPAQEHKYAQAKVVCARCPVIDACRAYSLTRPEVFGVWGGLTPNERRMARRRPFYGGL